MWLSHKYSFNPHHTSFEDYCTNAAHWLTLAKQRALIWDDAVLSLSAPREEAERGYREDEERYFF